MPTVLMEDSALEKDEGDEEESEKPAPVRREVPTVYMTELVASQCDRPIPCMMIPAPVQPGQTPGSTHRHSILSQRLSTISSFNPQQILTPQSKAYQLPLPFLSTVQKAALVDARLLVYAVPPGYTGPIPPPECAMVGEEIVPPWVTATSQLPVLSPGSPSSPRGSALGLSLRGISSPRNSVLSQSGLGPGPGPSGSLSPRWPVEGLWSRARGTGNSPRNSTMSVLSAEDSATSRPTSLLPLEKTGGEEAGATVSTWTTSFSSIRSKAQELYTRDKDQQQAPARTSSSDDGRLSTSKSDVLPTTSTSDESAPIPTSLSTSASRAFGSLFLRTPGANATTASTTAGPGGALSPSGVATPSTAGLQTPGLGPGPGMGEVLFEFTEPPKDGEIVKVEIIEAPPAPAASRWRGWGARWGS
ncbi:hypothetical protein M408DRAFT_263863 [Serendipita vermifera MAFF 305830]|uniref:Uncharacterized protein n=1 Tax=Serendipita vermifera MAFF 305830 TaxID=933852 RepID=A0A0C3AFD2_SERVB|nr:hypothetical protein M408DRAFT_263863 [Serendipita vermifera MAFF 305830]